MVKFSVVAATAAMALGFALTAPAKAWERGGWDQPQMPVHGYRAPPPAYGHYHPAPPHAYGPPPWRRRWGHWRRWHPHDGPRGW